MHGLEQYPVRDVKISDSWVICIFSMRLFYTTDDGRLGETSSVDMLLLLVLIRLDDDRSVWRRCIMEGQSRHLLFSLIMVLMLVLLISAKTGTR